MQQLRPPHPMEAHPWRARLCLLAAVLSVVVLGVLLASAAVDSGWPWPFAALVGAAYALTIVLVPFSLYWQVRRWIWRRRQGFPFRQGDVVELLNAERRGRRGHVVAGDQAQQYYLIEWGDTPRQREWVFAGRLRRSRHRS